ncbi:TIR domain-containing protein [Humitalea rosea]|uniref:TIR domain-containing protein n=1 Tax=Humitalea rosea TaxID=990373 RepID=A0A2W7I3R0_9PROT|nr:toll/interleukin-1 receptor domain-containing protein [Humitalea rosea]PZW40839.1 TIR domain-containing protein [Humitalea rosea]
MAGLTFNGKPFNPKDFEETMLRAVRDKVAAQVQASVGAIRDPDNGEFPTVVTSIDEEGNIVVRIEGSPTVLAVVERRLAKAGEEEEEEDVSGKAEVEPLVPKVFLSYGGEDRELAERIARALMDAGIDTWWAGWSIGAGDSLPQKINEGLGDCTHFVVLLTRTSVMKPWVKHEIDAGLMRRISAQARFIPLRHKLPADELPPLLRPLMSPAVDDPPSDIQQLINDIHGIVRKPVLGKPPAAKMGPLHEEYSAAANTVAKVFVERSETALFTDPEISLEELIAVTGLTRDDVVDAAHELREVLNESSSIGQDSYYPTEEMFVRFDGKFGEWNPAHDALRLATDLVNDGAFPAAVEAIAERYGWSARRLNPALAYLMNRKLIDARSGIGHAPWAAAWVQKTDTTRRFARSRT